VTNYDKFLLILWAVPVVAYGVGCLAYAGPDSPRRRNRLATRAAQRMNLSMPPELGDAVAGRIRLRHRTTGWIALAAAFPGAMAIFLLWRRTHSLPAPVGRVPAEDLVLLALVGVFGLGQAIGGRRGLRRPLSGTREDLAPNRLAPRLSDVLPRWFRWQQRMALLLPVAAAGAYLSESRPHALLADPALCLACLVAVGSGLEIERWQARIMREPQTAGASLQELGADDTMRVEFVLAVAWVRYLCLGFFALTALAAAPAPLAWGNWELLAVTAGSLTYLPLAPTFRWRRRAQPLLLWHRRRFAAGHADLAAQ
jgi:hypothetical protein